jgi:RNA polymerase sigma-70 factor, ECF subfamily
LNAKSLHSDLSLVINLRNGDKKAFEAIFNKYKLKLYYYALSYLQSKEEAEEVVQNAFIALWEHRQTLNELLSIKNYLYKSVVNHIYNHLKHEAVRQRYMDYTSKTMVEADEHVENEIIYNDLEKNLTSLIGYLPPQQQTIFKMSRFDGLSHAEIAEKLGLSVRSVENQVYRALKYLKENLSAASH